MNILQLPIAVLSGSLFMVGLLSGEDLSESSSKAPSSAKEAPGAIEKVTPRKIDYDVVFRDVKEEELKKPSKSQVNYFISGTDNSGFTHIAANMYPVGVFGYHSVWGYPYYWQSALWYDPADSPYLATVYNDNYHGPYSYYYPYGMVDRYYMNAWNRYEYERLRMFWSDAVDDELKPEDLYSAGLDDHYLGLFDSEEDAAAYNRARSSISVFISDLDYDYRGNRPYDVGVGVLCDLMLSAADLNAALNDKD